MKKILTSTALAAGISAALTSPVSAMTLEERIERLERQNQEQAEELQRLRAENQQQATQIRNQETLAQEQDRLLQGAPSRIERLEKAMQKDSGIGGGWFENIQFGGIVELEAAYEKDYEDKSKSDFKVATFELGIASQVNDWVAVEASVFYEEDDTPLEMDLVLLTIANPEVSPLFFTGGQFYVPFGSYATNLVSDPLTLDIGETRETAAQLGFDYQGLVGSAYLFNGDYDIDGNDQLKNWGLSLAYGQELETLSWSASAGYLNNLGDSDGLTNRLKAGLGGSDPTSATGAWTGSLSMNVSDFSLIGEYLTASSQFELNELDFDGSGAKPSAWNLEGAYSINLMSKDLSFAVGYQQTRESLGLGLPEKRWLAALNVEIFDSTTLSFEYHRDTDYGTGHSAGQLNEDGELEAGATGTGKHASAMLAKLAVEF